MGHHKSDKAGEKSGDKSATSGCLFLVRHGIAEDDHSLGDEARALSAEGRRAFRAFAMEIAPELDLKGIATSPLVRAVQTAEILADACGLDEVRSEGALAAEVATPAGITALARKLGPGWAFVGHNPSLALTLGAWLHGQPEELQFRKGGIAVVRAGQGNAPAGLVFMAAPGKKRLTSL